MLKIFNSIKKILKYMLTKLIEGLIVGIIAGVVVTYLFNTPEVSLIDTNVIVNDDKIDILCSYENKGKSAAINISSKYILAFENLNTNNFIKLKDSNLNRVEVGDNFSYSAKQLIIKNKSNFILLSKIEYEDVNRFRQFINEKLLNNSYTIYKWAFYDYKKENKYLSTLSLDLKEKYKKELLKRIEEQLLLIV